MYSRIFVSYAREDLEIARRIHSDLKKEGLRPWLDSEDLLPGERWKQRIREVIGRSDLFLLLMSSRSISKKGFVQKEIRQGLEILQELPDREIFLIPARIEDCHPAHELLQEINWVDLFPSYEQGLEKILRATAGRSRADFSKAAKVTASSVGAGTRSHPPARASDDPSLNASRTSEGTGRNDVFTVDTSPITDSRAGLLEYTVDYFSTMLDLMNSIWANLSNHVPAFSYGVEWGLRDAQSEHVFFEEAMVEAASSGKMREDLLAEAASLTLKAAGIVAGMELEAFPVRLNLRRAVLQDNDAGKAK